MARADAIVVGAGVIGLACSLYLARRGMRVLALDRGLPGAATTTATGGGVRLQFDCAENIRLSQLSWPFWLNFKDEFGVDPCIRNVGYLFIARTRATSDRLATGVRLQNAMGVESEYLDGAALATRWPELSLQTCFAGAYASAEFYLNHFRVVQGLVEGACAAGVRFGLGVEACSLQSKSGRITGVITSAGPKQADVVVVAAGPWSAKLAGTVGVRLPIVSRRASLMRVATESVPPGAPWIFDVDTGLHVRSDLPGHALVGGLLRDSPPTDPDDLECGIDPAWRARVLAGLAMAFPWFDRDCRVVRGWSGLYSGPPDTRPIVEESLPGLITATGFSGSGLMHAPAVGRLVGELAARAPLSMDILPFAASRFDANPGEWNARF
jgi:sarcosine oxidase subunit beta